MKILHTSDIHIGKKLYAYQRNEEQAAFLQELAQVCKEEQIDIVLIAGDLFDTFNPSVASMTLLYDSLYEISENGKRPIVAIAGNHDSADRIDMPDSFAKKNGIFFLGNYGVYQEMGKINEHITIEKSGANYLQIKLPKYNYPLQLIATPFVNEQRLREHFDIDNQEQALRDYLQNIWQQTIENFKDEEGAKVLMTHLFVIDDENDSR
ncbi:MAG: exonuclease subunit SbcD, partial [Bacteroidales bacterium]|nr:exonuclease subunit SbcD [Bacteroidales bacterium]